MLTEIFASDQGAFKDFMNGDPNDAEKTKRKRNVLTNIEGNLHITDVNESSKLFDDITKEVDQVLMRKEKENNI